MKLLYTLYLIILIIVLPSCAGSSWKPLFDGKTTSGWRGLNQMQFPASGWKVENGMLIRSTEDSVKSESGGDIITIEQYGNFELKWEWKLMSEGGNSGLKYFVLEELSEGSKYGIGLEYQICDDQNMDSIKAGKLSDGDYHALAALYEIYPAKNRLVKPVGQWNSSRIISRGHHAEHWLNGRKVLEYERGSEDFTARVAQSKFKTIPNFGLADQGHILLQDHGSPAAFRNIYIREL